MTQGDDGTAFDMTEGRAYSLSSFRPEDVSHELSLLTEALYDGDRRLDPRVPIVGVMVQMRVENSGESWLPVVPINFSRSGMQIQVSKEIAVGTIVWLEIQTNRSITGVSPFKVGAVVRHLHANNREIFTIGVEFRLSLTKSIQRIQTEHCISRLEGFLLAVNINNGAR